MMQTKPDIPDVAIPVTNELVKEINYNAKITEIVLVV